MAKLNKLKGSTLLEVLVAMVILSLSWVLALSIVLKVSNSSRNLLKVKAYMIVDSCFAESYSSINVNMEEQIGSFKVIKRLESYNNNANLKQYSIQVYLQDNRLLCERKRIIKYTIEGSNDK